MKTIISMTATLFVAITLTLIGCKKETVTGPAGPAGPTGPTGNANVKSQNLTTSSSSWTEYGTFGNPGQGYDATLTCSIITPDIVNTGAVLVYIDAGGGTWVVLPNSVVYSTWTSHWYYGYKTGTLIVDAEDSDGRTPNPNAQTFKVVAIASGRIANPDIDYSNYEAVKKAFNLKD